MTASYLLNAIPTFSRIRRAEAADVPGRESLGLVHMRKELARTVRARST